MKRYGLLRVALLVVILTACTAFSVYAEKVDFEVTGGKAVWGLASGDVSASYGVYDVTGKSYLNLKGILKNEHLSFLNDGIFLSRYSFNLFANSIIRIEFQVNADFYDFSNGFVFYLSSSFGDMSLFSRFPFVRLVFSDGSICDVEITAPSGATSYVEFSVSGNYGYNSITSISLYGGLLFSSSSVANWVDVEVYTIDPIPPEPADPPSPPIYGGSMSLFEVTAKNSGDGNISFYYEDIVNAFYLSAIDAGAMSYAEYPYTTVMSFLEGGYTCWYLIATDKPFYSNLYLDESNPDWIATADFPQGVSGVVFALSVPAGSLIAGEDYVFKSMTSFSNIGPFDFASYIRDGLPMPLDNGEFVVLDSLASLVMSFESQKVGRYAICSNYALTPQSHNTFGEYYPIKQSFKFAETWAQLLRLSSGDDQSAILRQIMESLRSTDLSVTVYERIEQIYNLMNDTSTLSPNDPIQSQIDKSVEALNEWSDSIGEPEIDEVLAVTNEISSSLDSIISSLGILGILGTIGLILGVIKVALQR